MCRGLQEELRGGSVIGFSGIVSGGLCWEFCYQRAERGGIRSLSGERTQHRGGPDRLPSYIGKSRLKTDGVDCRKQVWVCVCVCVCVTHGVREQDQMFFRAMRSAALSQRSLCAVRVVSMCTSVCFIDLFDLICASVREWCVCVFP